MQWAHWNAALNVSQRIKRHFQEKPGRQQSNAGECSLQRLARSPQLQHSPGSQCTGTARERGGHVIRPSVVQAVVYTHGNAQSDKYQPEERSLRQQSEKP
uniref:Transposase n=1 Tax=Esox lucius TaxID=8010 RepID=A0AAY5K1U5_ESOLU